MAVEAKRGCGFRQVGGLYLVTGAGDFFVSCDRLPFPLDECEHCGRAYDQTRGFTWVIPESLLRGEHRIESEKWGGLRKVSTLCPEDSCCVCRPQLGGERAGLMWVGQGNYSPEEFRNEGDEMGISKRINNIPKGFVVRKHWIYMAHPQACVPVGDGGKRKRKEKGPGIFMAFIPQKIERIVLQSHHEELMAAVNDIQQPKADEDVDDYAKYVEDYWVSQPKHIQALHRDIERGITLVPVPDDDPDHNPKAKGGTPSDEPPEEA